MAPVKKKLVFPLDSHEKKRKIAHWFGNLIWSVHTASEALDRPNKPLLGAGCDKKWRKNAFDKIFSPVLFSPVYCTDGGPGGCTGIYLLPWV